MRSIITVLLLSLFSMGQGDSKATLAETQGAASQALAAFRKVVNEENFRALGFRSVGEASSASLGTPMRVYTIPLDRLKEYQPGTNPNDLLDDIGQVIYPVMKEGEVRSALFVERTKNGWKGTGYGSPTLAKLLDTARRKDSTASGVPLDSYFIVQIPALNLYFVAHRKNQNLLLTAVADDPTVSIRAGTVMQAGEVLEALLPAAKAHDGTPR